MRDAAPEAANRKVTTLGRRGQPAVFFDVADGSGAEVIVMRTQASQTTRTAPRADAIPQDPGSCRKAVLAARQPLLRHAPLEDDGRDGTVVRLCPPAAMAAHFPLRLHALVAAFHDRIGLQAQAVPSPDGLGFLALLRGAVGPGQLDRVERALARDFFRPLGHRDAARFLGLEVEAFRALVAAGRIGAFDRVPSFRFGRRFSYAVYAPEDLIALRLVQGSVVEPAVTP